MPKGFLVKAVSVGGFVVAVAVVGNYLLGATSKVPGAEVPICTKAAPIAVKQLMDSIHAEDAIASFVDIATEVQFQNLTRCSATLRTKGADGVSRDGIRRVTYSTRILDNGQMYVSVE
jgi:hypothetical protein